jgi:hypothetical protein
MGTKMSEKIFNIVLSKYLRGFMTGAFILCCFASLQKVAIGAPLVINGYLVPVLFGGAAGWTITLWHGKLQKTSKALEEANENLEMKITERTRDLEKALSEIKSLTGLLPICSHCKKIRDDRGNWNQIESYIQENSDAIFSHSLCQDCAKKYYPDFDLYEKE